MDHLTPGTLYDAVVEGILVSSYDVTVLQRFTDFVYQQVARGSLDAVILTGDIATTGDPEELEKALEFFEAPPDYRLGTQTFEQEPTLAGVPIPIFLLPGNHDRYRTGPGYAPGGVGYGPGGQQFDRIFERYWHGPVMPALNSNATEYHPICNC
jgi:3',5'-cyclic AMP phosphodiesterase CpdA